MNDLDTADSTLTATTELTLEQIHAARKTVCSYATDSMDARLLMQALGLLPEEQR